MKRVLLGALMGFAVIGTAHAQDAGPAIDDDDERIVVTGTRFAAKVQFAAGYATSNEDLGLGPLWDEGYATLQGDGRVSIPLGQGWTIQADVSGSKNFTDGDSLYDFTGGFNTTGHVSYRDGRNFLLGGYGGFGQVATNFVWTPNQFVTGGLEGQFHYQRATLYGQVGYATVSTSDPFDPGIGPKDTFYGRLMGRYFFDDDSYLQAEGTYGNGGVDAIADDEITFYGWGARYERSLANTRLPINYFVEYRGTSAKWDALQLDENQHAFLLGGSIRFGGVGNYQNNREGATLEPTEDVYQVMGLTARFIP